MVEFNDKIRRSSSNFKSIEWKLRILEISPWVVDLWPMFIIWPMLTSKRISGWIHWPNMQLLFKFQVNRRKIHNFRNLAYVDLLTSKTIGGWIQWPDMQMLFKFQVNQIEVEDFRNLAYVDLFGWCWSSKIIVGWIQWLHMQMFFKFQVNRMKIEGFRNSCQC